jgi:hypothetical protein
MSSTYNYNNQGSVLLEDKQREAQLLEKYNAKIIKKPNPYSQYSGPEYVTVYHVFPSNNSDLSLRNKARELAKELGIDNYNLIENETNDKINYIEIDDSYNRYFAGGKRRKTQRKKSLKRKNKKTKSNRK